MYTQGEALALISCSLLEFNYHLPSQGRPAAWFQLAKCETLSAELQENLWSCAVVGLKEKKKAVLTKEEEAGKWWRESASLLRLKSGVSVSAGVCAQMCAEAERDGQTEYCRCL